MCIDTSLESNRMLNVYVNSWPNKCSNVSKLRTCFKFKTYFKLTLNLNRNEWPGTVSLCCSPFGAELFSALVNKVTLTQIAPK